MMTPETSDLFSGIPDLLKPFQLKPVEAGLSHQLDLSASFKSHQVLCACGSPEWLVQVYATEETKGFFRKKTVVNYWAPAYLRCPSCDFKHLLFDPRMHGWNGVLGYPGSVVEAGDLVDWSQTPEPVVVAFSYNNPEEYTDFVDDPEIKAINCFDTFILFMGNQPTEVFNYECA